VLPTAWVVNRTATAFHYVYRFRTPPEGGYPTANLKGLTRLLQFLSVVLPGNQAFHLFLNVFLYGGYHRLFDAAPLLPVAKMLESFSLAYESGYQGNGYLFRIDSQTTPGYHISRRLMVGQTVLLLIL